LRHAYIFTCDVRAAGARQVLADLQVEKDPVNFGRKLAPSRKLIYNKFQFIPKSQNYFVHKDFESIRSCVKAPVLRM
jgi:hypothetical protein